MAYYMLTRGDRVREWKSTIDQAWPVLIGIYLSDDYHRLDHDHNNPLPSSSLPAVGSPLTSARHAAVVVGYSEDPQGNGVFIVSDSRGMRFGDRGRWLLPYSLVNSGLVIEAWTVRFITYEM